MKVLLLHTLPPPTVGEGRDSGEFDLSLAAAGIAEVIADATVLGVRGELLELLDIVREHRPDVVFNACEAPLGQPELEAHVPMMLEWLGIRYTGARSDSIALCRRKDRVNAVLAAAGVPIPATGNFPCIVKPASEHASAGIDDDSVCRSPADLQRALSRLTGPVVVQEFLPGREFVVSMWGQNTPDNAMIGETRFKNGLTLNTYAAKWDVESPDFANSPLFYDVELDAELREALLNAARGAWLAVEGHGYLRVDLRLDSNDRPRVLDVNANPELAPGAGIHRAVVESGYGWARFIASQIEWAC
jgi:D-alanine-D-alanine ligase